ncbi:hypothetical protein BDV12DRAFT_174521 [Aspergillus spectabilis]
MLIGRPCTRARRNLGLHMGWLSCSLLVVSRRGLLSTSLSVVNLVVRYHSFSVESTRAEDLVQADALVSSQASCDPRNSISFRECGPMPVVYLGVPTSVDLFLGWRVRQLCIEIGPSRAARVSRMPPLSFSKTHRSLAEEHRESLRR